MIDHLVKLEAQDRTMTTSSSYVDLQALFAGAFVAAAISFVLLTFGAGLGLSLSSSFSGSGYSLGFYVVAIGLWLVWVQASSCMAGAYFTGRLRQKVRDSTEHEVQVRDGAHGLIVWAIATLIGGWLAAYTIASSAGAGASAAKTTASSIVSGIGKGFVTSVADLEKRDQTALDYSIDMLFRAGAVPGSAVPGGQASTGPQTVSPLNGKMEARNEVRHILAVSDVSNPISEADKNYLSRIVSRIAGLPPEQANQRVNDFVKMRNESIVTIQKATDRTRKFGIILAFTTAVSLLVAAAASWWAAITGGAHRDEETVLPILIWRK